MSYDELYNAVKVLKDNEVYRMNDVLNVSRGHKIIKKIKSDDTYKGTLLREYLMKPQSRNKYNALYDVMCKQKRNYSLPFMGKNDAVMHVRLGDDIKRRGLENKKNMDFYINSSKKYRDVYIVTALHYGTSRDKNALYKTNAWNYKKENHEKNIHKLSELISKMQNKGRVFIVSNENIDLDCMFLVFSKNLITSPHSGGFSKLVSKLHALYTHPHAK